MEVLGDKNNCIHAGGDVLKRLSLAMLTAKLNQAKTQALSLSTKGGQGGDNLTLLFLYVLCMLCWAAISILAQLRGGARVRRIPPTSLLAIQPTLALSISVPHPNRVPDSLVLRAI